MRYKKVKEKIRGIKRKEKVNEGRIIGKDEY